MSSVPVPLTAHRIPSPPPRLPFLSNPRNPTRFSRQSSSAVWLRTRQKSRAWECLRSKTGDGEVVLDGGSDECSCDRNGSLGDNGGQTAKGFSSKELMQNLKRYGVAGVLSYGLLNTLYYLTTFLLVWFYFAPAPGKMGYPAAVERFLKVMAMVWAGSQVTKIARAGGALALAPFVDNGLSWFTVKFKFESKGKAFAAIAGVCFGLAILLFFGLTLLWA